MTTKETIRKINNALDFGDRIEIVKRTGISNATVSRFFSCKYMPTYIKQTKLVNAALSIIEERQKEAKAQEERANHL